MKPSIRWARQHSSTVTTTFGSSLELNFDPVMTSDGDSYTCWASVDITEISVSVSGQASRDLSVMCKFT